jgi:superfamily II DNA or RNA helicase
MTLSAEGPTLRLSLDARARVLMTSSTSPSALSRLLISYPNARRDRASELSIPLGQFLENLGGLRVWTVGPVEWDTSLAKMARASIENGHFLDALYKTGDGERLEFSIAGLIEATQVNWVGDLTEFQIRDIRRMLKMRHGSNFSVPGAGKTRTALAAYSALKACDVVDSLVVVAPKSAHESWSSELAAVYVTPPAYSILDSIDAPFAEVSIVNYERLASLQTRIAQRMIENRTLFVLDEAHRMKRGADGVYGAVCLSLGPLAARRLVLSGTPLPNGLGDLSSLMEFAWPGRGAGLVSGSGISTLAVDLAPMFTRTTKTDLALPPMSITIQRLALPPLHRQLYDALLGRLSYDVRESEKIDDLGRVVVYLLMAATSPALLAVGASRYEALQFRVPPLTLSANDRIRSMLAELPAQEMSPKILESIRIAKENAQLGKKTLIWSTFLRNISTIAELARDLNPAIVTGASSDEERKASIKRFREDPDCFILLSNPATLGEGISLHRECHDAVYLDRDFAAGRFLQSLDRIHRLGLPEDTATNVRILVSEGTIDELVAVRLDSKIRLMERVLDDPSLRQLIDLDENRESGSVIDASDVRAVWAYLGRN